MKQVNISEGGPFSEKNVRIYVEKGKLNITACDVDSYINVELTKEQLTALKELLREIK